MTTMNTRSGKSRADILAEKMYDTYNAAPPNPGKNYAGLPCPPWENVGAQVQKKWTAVAQAVIDGMERGIP